VGGGLTLLTDRKTLKNTRGPILKKNHALYYIPFGKQLVVRYINATSLELPHTQYLKESRKTAKIKYMKRTHQEESKNS
jgi:hypothetical protein